MSLSAMISRNSCCCFTQHNCRHRSACVKARTMSIRDTPPGAQHCSSVRSTATNFPGAEIVLEFAREHIGSGKDIDDIHDDQRFIALRFELHSRRVLGDRYGHVVGVKQRHKWGLDPSEHNALSSTTCQRCCAAARGTPLQQCSSVPGSAAACRMLIDHGANINFCLPSVLASLAAPGQPAATFLVPVG